VGAAIGFMLFLLMPGRTFAQVAAEPAAALHAITGPVAAAISDGLQPIAAAAGSGEGAELGRELILRPAPGLEPLASRIARVLSLRFGSDSVRVGDAPPPGLLEAVPAGHVALGFEGGRIRLVLGAALGHFFEASVPLSAQTQEPDVRSLALAVEALRDRALESSERSASAKRHAAGALPPTAASERSGVRPPPWGSRARDLGAGGASGHGDASARREVVPMVFVRMYGGASIASTGLRRGMATGGGLCVQGHCLVLSIETPLPGVLEASATDVRYRYPTFTSGFYSRPWQFGSFAPAASIGFLSRVGHFRRDMGMLGSANSGLDTDLGLRGTLEASLTLIDAVELTSELGVDYALDRWRLGLGDTVAYRGDRASLWAQAGVRVRPY
jgi:hypothetical protein